MKIQIALALITVAVAFPALARDNEVQALAEASGLSERKVRMLLGNRTAFAEYRASYDRSLEQFQKAIGKDNYQRLISGQSIVLPRHSVNKVTVAVTKAEEPAKSP